MADSFFTKWERVIKTMPIREPDQRPTKLHDIIDSIIRDICELPDRTSPDGQPDVMLVSDGELRDILWRHLGDGQ